MPEMRKYEPGTPSWVDVASPDPQASARFYCELFGWTADVSSDPAAGGYTMFRLDGRDVAGMGPAAPGQPPAWSTYVSVEDADATARKAQEAGGSVLVAPMDVLTVGRMAVLADPTGAAISIWQPRDHIGAGLVNEPNTLCWNELQSRDPASARPFYEQVFGWRSESAAGPVEYTQFMLGDRGIGGMVPMPEVVPDQVPSHWAVYFSVSSCAATIEKARALGGTPMDPVLIPPGTMAVIADPHRAMFQVLEFS
jgi:predicted enzyme related to lactoylglutathione lyase